MNLPPFTMFYNDIYCKRALEFALEGALRFFSFIIFFYFLFGGGGGGGGMMLIWEGNKLGRKGLK